MGENMLNSTCTGMKRSSSLSSLLHVNKDIGELVWENGAVKVHGGEAAAAAVEEIPAKLDKRLYYTSNLDQSKKQIQQGFSTFKLNHNNVVVGKVNSNSNGKQLCTYSSFNSTLSSQCKKPRIIDSSGSSQAITKSHTLQYLGTCNNNNNNNNQRTSLGGGGGMINFPNFLIPALFLNKSSSSSSAAAAAAATSSKGHDHSSVVIDSSNNNKSATQELKERPFHQVQVQPLDQYSHAQQLYHGASSSSAAAPPPPPNNSKRNNNNEQHLVASSPVCSIGASNDPIMKKQHEEYTNITDHDDTTTYISDDVDEETEDVIAKETPAAAGTRAKRIRDPEIHNLSEKKRRDKINKRIRTLKELIPNCNKIDKASTLDDAIDYLKTLKLQLQIMSMGSGLCMPVMMLPNHQNQLMGGGTGMCYRPSGTGIPQFHIPHDSTRLIQNMFGGFFNQMRPMIMPPSPPFINPITGNPSITPPLAPMSITNSSTLEVSHVQAMKPEYATNNNQVSLHQHGTSSSYPFYFPTIINQEENNKEGNRR